MMDCTHYRRSILADPDAARAHLHAHLSTCRECAAYTEQVRRFEDRLGRALRVELGAAPGPSATVVPLRPNTRRLAAQRRVRRGWLAAASVALGAVIAGSLWLAVPARSLAAAVVDHMAGEPAAWSRTQVAVPAAELEQVLSASHVRLRSDAGLVSYASSCEFRGHRVPHLVLQTRAGPVTVMVLTHETTHLAMHFDEQGYRGTIVPVPGRGSLAVLERGPDMSMAVVDEVAQRVLAAIDWTP